MRITSSGKVMILLVLCGVLFLAGVSLAGESGTVTCTTPGCGYQTDLRVGGGRNTPRLTGYCLKEKKFVQLKLTSYDEYHDPHNCPKCNTRLVGIRDAEKDIPLIPCPHCGKLNLQYKLKYRFD